MEHAIRLPRSAKGFSLVEILVVLAIVGILAALTIPAFTSISHSVRLNQAAELLVGQISLARQIASTKSTTVEVRMIETGSGAASGYGAIQLWIPDSQNPGSMKPASRLLTFPEDIVISNAADRGSRLMNYLDPPAKLPAQGAASEAAYVSFQIRPSGTVVPVVAETARDELYMTVHSAREATGAGLPDNYVTIQLNPETGTTSVYRP